MHGLPLTKITRAHIAARLAEIEEGTGAAELGRGAYAAARAKTAINSLFVWAMTKGLLRTNPVLGTEVELVEKARKRTLDGARREPCGNARTRAPITGGSSA